MKTLNDLAKEYIEFSAYEPSETVYSGNTTVTMPIYDDKTQRIPNNNFKVKGMTTCFVFGVGDMI